MLEISDFYVVETIRYSLWTYKMILLGPLTNSNRVAVESEGVGALLGLFLNCLKSEEAVQCFPQDFVGLVAAGDITYAN